MSATSPRSTLANAGFATTHWSLVLQVGGGTADAARALEVLCRNYWPPIYAYARRDGLSPPDAQDAAQEFIAQLLRRDDLAGMSPLKGRFRSFLLAALKNFLISRSRAARALKRGGATETLPLDLQGVEALCQPELTDRLSPDRAFDRRWACTIMARALDSLQSEHQSPQQAKLLAALQPVLADGGRVQNQVALAGELGVTPGALASAATRLRQRYRALIEDEVRQTLHDPTDLANEMQALREAWT